MEFLILYDNALTPLADLNNLEDAKMIREVNGQFVLTYSAYKQELKTEYILNGNVTEADNQYFDIVYYEKTHEENNKISFAVEAWHVFYRLKQEKYDYYTFDGTPEQILTNMLSGTPFTVGQVDFVDVMTFAVNEETNAAQLIYLLAATLGGEVEFTQKGFEINLLNTIGQDNGFEIRLGKNIKGITEVADARSGSQVKSYEVDILELKNSTEYIQKGLQELEIIDIGDTVYVIDEEAGIDITNRIVKVEYDPRYRKNTVVEIANKVELLTDKLTKIERTTVTKGKVYYGIKISNEQGFEVERNDKLARSVFNADTFAMQSGDGLGSYTDALYFDPINRKYNFEGDITMLGGSISWADTNAPTATDVGALPSNTFIPDDGYITTITENTIATTNLIASNLHVRAANILDTITLSQVATIGWGDVANKPTDLVYEHEIADFVTDSQLTTTLGYDYIVTGDIYANQITGNQFSAISGIEIGSMSSMSGYVQFYSSGFNSSYLELNSSGLLTMHNFNDITIEQTSSLGTLTLSSSYKTDIIADDDINIYSAIDNVNLMAGDDVSIQCDTLRLSANDIRGLYWEFITGNPFRYSEPEDFVADDSKQGIQMQYFNDHIEVRIPGGSWKVIYFD